MNRPAILFDLDGTLWDSSESVCASWNETLQRDGRIHRRITKEEIHSIMGLLLPEIAAKLFPELSPSEGLSLAKRAAREECEYLISHGAEVFEGEEELLRALSPLADLYIVSNCDQGYIEAYLEYTGFGSFFTDTICAGSTGEGKKENLHILLRKHGIERAVFVGDTEHDWMAAVGNGVPYVHCNYGFGSVPYAEAKIDKLMDLYPMICGWIRKGILEKAVEE